MIPATGSSPARRRVSALRRVIGTSMYGSFGQLGQRPGAFGGNPFGSPGQGWAAGRQTGVRLNPYTGGLTDPRTNQLSVQYGNMPSQMPNMIPGNANAGGPRQPPINFMSPMNGFGQNGGTTLGGGSSFSGNPFTAASQPGTQPMGNNSLGWTGYMQNTGDNLIPSQAMDPAAVAQGHNYLQQRVAQSAGGAMGYQPFNLQANMQQNLPSSATQPWQQPPPQSGMSTQFMPQINPAQFDQNGNQVGQNISATGAQYMGNQRFVPGARV